MNSAREHNSPTAATLLLALLATAALECARWGFAPRPWVGWLTTAVALLAAAAAGAWLRRGGRSRGNASWAVILAAGFAAAPFACEWFARRAEIGESPEIVLLVALRNLMLALAAAGAWKNVLRLSGVLSVFVSLGALMFLASWPGYVALLLYGIAGVWWLMGAYWERLQGRFAEHSRREIPLTIGSGVVLLVLVAAGAAALAFTGVGSAGGLSGWFWTSGGAGGDDPFAARGIGSGQQLVAAQDDAASFGAVESELFLDSEMPSLYDMFNDTYGEPLTKLKKEQERAVAIKASPDPPRDGRTAASQQAGREFSTVRRRTGKRPQRLADGDDSALLFVAGRVPLHLRLETFDTFDGRTWSHGEPAQAARSPLALAMVTDRARTWLEIRRLQESAAVCPTETHTVKIIRLSTARIPTPAHPRAVHIDKVEQRGFYDWTDDDVLAMPGRDRIPPLTVLHIRSQSLDGDKLGELASQAPRPTAASYLALAGERSGARLRELARAWTAGVPPGHAQVAAIESRLRGGVFSVDPAATLPADCDDAAAEFLFRSRRGPDHLFATSAALLLRSLGYPARVASGLYVNPVRYDRQTRQTTVEPEDVHFWVEVCLDGSAWITVEPTPGYATLPPRRTWWEATVLAGRELIWLVSGHPVRSAGILLLLFLAVVLRRELANFGYTLVWLLLQLRPSRERLLATIWLVERRAALAGWARPPHATLDRWYAPLARHWPVEDRRVVRELLLAAAHTLYAPSAREPGPAVIALCRSAVFCLTLGKLRRLPRIDLHDSTLSLSEPTTA